MITHICTQKDWEKAQTQGEYRAVSLETEGFIHCSRPDQVLDVVNAFYQNTPNLVLLWIDPTKTRAEIRWEAPFHPSGSASPPPNHAIFPHLYGPLNLDAVEQVTPLQPNKTGVYDQLPPV
jgi:uncharacterized protein (DUF952 family)